MYANLNLSAIILMLLLLPFGNAWAVLTTVTYQVQSSDFEDSNNNPPNAPTSTNFGGIFSFTFDSDIAAGQTGIIPDSVFDFDMIDNDGDPIDYDVSNTGARIVTAGGPGARRITFGGIVSGEHQMVGLTEPGDFATIFDVDDTTYQVIGNEQMVFLTRHDPFYTANIVNVQLLSVSAVPLPATFPFLLSGLAWIGARRRKGG